MGIESFRRVTDLFVEGREVVCKDAPDAILVWVQKPNSFEYEEARHDGQVARARLVMALKDPAADELAMFRSSLAMSDDDELVDSVLYARAQEDDLRAIEEIRNDPEWTERLDIMERGQSQLAGDGRPTDDPEYQASIKIMGEYNTEWSDRREKLVAERERDLRTLKRDKLEAVYEDVWMEARGNAAFQTQARLTEVYYALRECVAVARDGNGRWDHSHCDHSRRALDARADVKRLPSALLEDVRAALDAMSMSARDARFSDRQESSSASSPLPSEEGAASTPSGQDATPNEPAGTSSSRSATRSRS